MTSSEQRIDRELAPGMVLRGKYRVERVLGAGGMGKVVEAFHVHLERRVAIKVLHPDLRTHTELVERFIREGRAAARVEGEHVAKVLDVDNLDDGTPFLVMEFLDGADLSAVRRSRVPLSVSEALDYVLQACSAIAEAHHHGIIHRDIKPANLFLTRRRDGTRVIKVLDFGISKASRGVGGSEPSMTRTSVVMGSAEYMSPEQMLSTRDVDARADVWGLGAVLFELLTARPPFAGETMTQVCAMVMSIRAPTVRSLRPDIPEEVDRVVHRCLQKDREHRFATVEELAAALANALDQLAPNTIALPAARPSAVPEPTPAASPSAVAEPMPALATSVLPVAGALAPVVPNLAAETPRESVPGGVATGLSSSTSLSSSGLLTSVPVSSDPLPDLPKRSSSAAAIGLTVLALAVGAALFVFLQLRPKTTEPRDPSLTVAASDPPRDDVAVEPPALAASAPSIETSSISPSAPPAPPQAAPSAPSSAVAMPGPRSTAQAAAISSTRAPGTQLLPSAKPLRTSGID